MVTTSIKILKKIPFSYLWLLESSIGRAKTIIDVGCGDGELMEILSNGKNWQIDGLEIYHNSVKKAQSRKIYQKIITGDLIKSCEKLVAKGQKYDVVFCSQVIEHITRKDGQKLLKLADKLAKRRIVVGTPREFMIQPHEFLGGNPYQVHLSGWNDQDFIKRGYKVFGVGFKPIWSENGLARARSKMVLTLLTVISFFVSPLIYFATPLAAGILCIKDKK